MLSPDRPEEAVCHISDGPKFRGQLMGARVAMLIRGLGCRVAIAVFCLVICWGCSSQFCQ